MAHNQPTPPQQHQQPPERQNPYPPATSIAPTIFIPISGDELTAPFTPPSNRIELLQSKIAVLNENSKRVRANILALMRRECTRILWDANNEARNLKEAGRGDEINGIGSEVVSEEELDHMIECMAARSHGQPKEQGRPVEVPNFQPLLAREGISFRETYSLLIGKTISQGLSDLDGYEQHVERIRTGYMNAWKREMEHSAAMDLD